MPDVKRQSIILNRWPQIMDLHTKRQDENGRNCNGPSGTQSSPADEDTIDESIHRQIEALIPRLRNYARVLTRDAVAADDLVQDCFARALGKIHLWAEGTDLRAWLFTILHHQHISLARRDARQRASIQSQRCHLGSTFSPPQTGRLE